MHRKKHDDLWRFWFWELYFRKLQNIYSKWRKIENSKQKIPTQHMPKRTWIFSIASFYLPSFLFYLFLALFLTTFFGLKFDFIGFFFKDEMNYRFVPIQFLELYINNSLNKAKVSLVGWANKYSIFSSKFHFLA